VGGMPGRKRLARRCAPAGSHRPLPVCMTTSADPRPGSPGGGLRGYLFDVRRVHRDAQLAPIVVPSREVEYPSYRLAEPEHGPDTAHGKPIPPAVLRPAADGARRQPAANLEDGHPKSFPRCRRAERARRVGAAAAARAVHAGPRIPDSGSLGRTASQCVSGRGHRGRCPGPAHPAREDSWSVRRQDRR